ncbi:MAG TPA: nitrate reductase [Archaeoglobaceae archaeon]|nr:nitrate reductase [Archaeoglobaceae archaeon]
MVQEYFIGGVMPYITALLLIVGIIYRAYRWSKSPQILPWEIFPYPETTGAQLKYLLTEILTQHALREHNRRMWIPALILHWGLYLVVIWVILVLVGIQNAYYIGMLGAAGILIGTIISLVIRLSTEIRRITAFVEYFNLLFLLVLSVLGLSTNFFEVVNRVYLYSLIMLSPKTDSFTTGSVATLFLVQLFLIYLPYNRMAHFFAKYFTYHQVKWGHPGH